MEGDRERWNATWRERAAEMGDPLPFLVEHAAHLPTRGKALDVAGGGGHNAIWLARRGLDVTLIDVSDVALVHAERWANMAGLARRMRFVRVDLDATAGDEALSLAPLFDVVLIANYLNRARRDELANLAVPDGIVIAVQPTRSNLERHAHPSERYLVEPGELEAWVQALGMTIVAAHEGWTDDGRHEAAVIARRTTAAPVDVRFEDSGPSHGPYR